MAKVEVTMPKMGESITEGTVVTWHKQPGDTVELDESLLEIGTDKVDTDVPSPGAGILVEVLAQEGDTVDVGTVIAVIDTNGEALAQKGVKQESETIDSTPAPARTAPVPAVVDTPAPKMADQEGGSVDVRMPKMGESIMEGTVLTWLKFVGDHVDLDEPLLEIATDKVDTEVPSPAAGTLTEVLVGEGETVAVETRIAVIATSESVGTAGATASKPSPAAVPAVKQHDPVMLPGPDTSDQQPAVLDVQDVKGSLPRQSEDGRFLSPLVRAIAEKEGVSSSELAKLAGTGREGRVTKGDILAYVQSRGSSSAVHEAPRRTVLSPASPVPAKQDGERIEVVKMNRMRQLISEHMTRSKSTSAHVTSFAEADVTNLVRLRERNKEAFLQREGVKLTYTPFFVFASVEALREHPILNASVVENEIHFRKDYHIGIAVAIGKTGLVVPVIHDAGQKNIVGLAHAAANIAERSRTKQLMPDELQGGTFTVTNVGSLGSIMGTPIINQPQVGILATGVIKKRPVVIEHPEAGDSIGIRHMMYVSLSYDHRVVDGAMGSSFLAKFVDVVESFDPNEVIK